MPAGYETKFSGDDRELQRAYARLEKAAQRQADELRKLRNESDRGGEAAKAAGKKQVGAFDAARREAARLERQIKNTRISGGVVDPGDIARLKELRKSLDDAGEGLAHVEEKNKSSAKGFLKAQAVIEGARKAYGVFNEVLDAHAEKASSAKTQILDLAIAQQEATKNLAGSSTAIKTQLMEQDVRGIMRRTGFADAKALTRAIGGATSAGGGERESVRAVELSALVNRSTPEKVQELAESMFDLRKSIKGFDLESLAAFQITSGRINRAVDPASLAASLAPAVGSAIATISTGRELDQDQKSIIARQTSAVFGDLSQRMADRDGKRSKHATEALVAQMRTFLADRGQTVPTDLFQMMRLFKDGTEFHKEFFEGKKKATFDRGAAAHVRAILAEGISDELQSKFDTVGFSQTAFEKIVAELGGEGSTFALKLARREKRIEAEQNRQREFTKQGQILANFDQAKKVLDVAMEGRFLRGTATGKKLSGFLDSAAVASGGEVLAIDRMQAELARFVTSIATDLKGKQLTDLSQDSAFRDAAVSEFLSRPELTEFDRERLETLRALLEVMTEIRGEVHQTNQAQHRAGSGSAVAARGE